MDRPITGLCAQMCRKVSLQMKRREAAAEEQAKRLTVTCRARSGELNGVEKFQCTPPETNAALNSETVDGINP
jgi:hypothetical protein